MMWKMLQAIKYLKDICKKIIFVDSTIRFAKIINDKGHLVTWATKENIQFYVNVQEHEMLFMEAALRSRILYEFDSSLSIVNFYVYHRKNVITMKFLMENQTIYVSAEKEIDLNTIPVTILKPISKENMPSI